LYNEAGRRGQIERVIIYNLRTSGSPPRHLCQLIGLTSSQRRFLKFIFEATTKGLKMKKARRGRGNETEGRVEEKRFEEKMKKNGGEKRKNMSENAGEGLRSDKNRRRRERERERLKRRCPVHAEMCRPFLFSERPLMHRRSTR